MTISDNEIDEEEELVRNRLKKMSNLVLIDYIRSLCQHMYDYLKKVMQQKIDESPRDLPDYAEESIRLYES